MDFEKGMIFFGSCLNSVKTFDGQFICFQGLLLLIQLTKSNAAIQVNPLLSFSGSKRTIPNVCRGMSFNFILETALI